MKKPPDVAQDKFNGHDASRLSFFSVAKSCALLEHRGGADNFFEAGSCVDGRLTSAWNWCAQVPPSGGQAAFEEAS